MIRSAKMTAMILRRGLGLSVGDFSYLECGSGDPVVFLHALGRSASDWAIVMEALAGDWRCIALDQRGHGESVRPGLYGIEAMAADLSDFVDALAIERFTLIAHSMGGTVAWLFAQRWPERLRALVLEDTPVPSDRHDYPEIPESPPEPVDYDWAARRQLFGQLRSPDLSLWSGISTIDVPTLLVSGSDFDEELEVTAAILPRGELIRIPVGHWIHEKEPDSFVEAVRIFLAR